MSPRPTTPLRVHVRRVLGGDGELVSENELYCVVRQRTLPVAECERCADYDGSFIDFEHHRNFAACAGVQLEATRGVGPTRRPLLIRRHGHGASPATRTAVADIMVCDVLCAREDLRTRALAALMIEKAIGAVPVVDGSGHATGMVAQRDLLRVAPEARVRDVMTPLAFVLPDNATVAEAAALMALERVHHLPIVTDDGKVCGIVSSLDVLGWLARNDGYVVGQPY